ncbi:hypothetical protein [Shewanella xiamenensis]|uniref:hypothetical protein n=1 Tax=Shewanella xiamenensis TaxID=332186 RepID=UPI002E7C453E|nr:hypothetical protein [Shewanella xiamenensis]MEE1981520.1 hypothetical protein [Shewanella xiamenensis]
MRLPQLAELPNNSALRDHRLKHPSQYEKIIKHDDGLTRYFSDTTATCVGEWVLTQFVPAHTEWLLLLSIDTERWYGLHVNQGRVLSECVATNLTELITQLAYECEHSEQIYSPDSNLELPAKLKTKCSTVNAFNLNAIPNQFILKKKEVLPKKTILGLIGALITGSALWFMFMNHTPVKQGNQTDPLALWITQLAQTPTAESVFVQSQLLLDSARLLPKQWELASMTLSGTQLALQLNSDEPSANRALLMAWLLSLERNEWQWNDSERQITAFIPLSPQLQIDSLGEYPELLYEDLRLLNAESLAISHMGITGAVDLWTISGKFLQTAYSRPSTLASLLKNKPVFLQEFTIQPGNEGLDITFSFTILGKPQ